MSTSILNAEILLSKALGDYWSSLTTGTGSSVTNIQDTALKAKANDWIDGDGEMYIMITDSTAANSTDEEERKATALSNTNGDLTVLALSGDPGDGKVYRIHRIFTASEKRRAIVHAAKSCYPHLFTEIRDESMVSGNRLKDGALLKWTTSTNPTYWTASGVTVTKTTTLPYFKHSTQSAKLDTAAGYIYQDIALWGDLQKLAGKTVTFTAQGHCDTASCLRLGILYDGTNLTYSDYHDGDSAFTEDDDPLEVKVTIDDNPTDIEFRVYHAVAAGTSYVNDLRVIGPDGARIYVGDLGLVQNSPIQVLRERSNYREPWLPIRGWTLDSTNGYLHLPNSVVNDYRLRILGTGYLDFYDTSDVVGTDWADTIALDSPQTEILVAEAAVYLCNQMIVPNFTSGESERWIRALGYWKGELIERRMKFAMELPAIHADWGLE